MAVSKYKTLGDIRARINRELDTQDEDFVRPEEMTGYINDAIDEAEAEIHTIYEDYFLTRSSITLAENQEEYELPANIYAHKIVSLVYNAGTDTSSKYPVHRVRDWKKFLQYQLNLDTTHGSREYRYFIVNEVAGAPRIIITPPPNVSGDFLKIAYLRQANHLVDESDLCDIVEFYSFIYAYVKEKVFGKEVHPGHADAKLELAKQRDIMVGTLTSMTPDMENEIEADVSFYEDMN